MAFLIQYLLLSASALLFGYLAYVSLFKKDAYFSWNRYLMLALLLFSHLAPLLLLILPSASLFSQIYTIEYPTVIVNGLHHITSAEPTSNLTFYILIRIYALGVLMFASNFAYQLIQIERLKRKSKKSIWNGNKLFIHEEDMEPFSFRSSIFLPKKEAQKTSTTSLLVHEAIHINEKHSLDILLIKVLQIIFWFNPIYFLYKNELKGIHEYICDQKALHHISESDYRIALLSVQLTNAGIPITHSFNQLNLKRRFSMMKKQKSGRLGFKVLLLIPILGLSTVFLTSMIPPFTLTSIEQDAIEEAVVRTTPEDEEVTPPSYPGGQAAMMNFIASNISYPELAKNKGITGTVYVSYLVAKSGKVKKVKVIRGIASEDEAARQMEAESVRVIELMPDWTPAKKNGKNIRMEMTIPIKFQLD